MAVALLEVFTTLLLENKVFALYTWLIWLQNLDYSHFVQPVLSLVSLGCANKIYTVRSFISLEREPASMSRSPMQCTIQCNAYACQRKNSLRIRITATVTLWEAETTPVSNWKTIANRTQYAHSTHNAAEILKSRTLLIKNYKFFISPELRSVGENRETL